MLVLNPKHGTYERILQMGNLRFRHAIPTLRIASIEKSLPFYKALGFEISWQHQLNPDAPRLTSVTHESVELFLTEHTVAPFGSVVYLVVEGLDEIVAQARAKGIEPSFGPEDRPWGNREAYFTDTDSNVIRLGEQLADTAAESQAGAA